MKFPAASLVAAFVSTKHSGTSSTSTSTSTPSSSSSSALSMLPLYTPMIPVVTVVIPQATSTSTSTSSPSFLSANIGDWLQQNIGVPPANAATSTSTPPSPPTNQEVETLQQAFAAFYGASRDPTAAESLLSQTIESWQRQAPDEQAGLYRVRGDCYMALLRPQDAIRDYSKAISLIQGPGGDKADPIELPSSFLGRARALRSLHTTATKEQAQMAVADYETALKLSAKEGDDFWDTDQELLEDGARSNPYATWEYGMALRLNGDYAKAQAIHTLSADLFDEIGDRARSVISSLDAGIDSAALTSSSNNNNNNVEETKVLLKTAIQKVKTIEGRDIPLLQRAIAKEGEGRMALASVLWTSGDRPDAEAQLGLACERLDQLEADAMARNKINAKTIMPPKLFFSIDDTVGALDISCSRLKNKDFLNERLEWPEPLQQKVNKLYTLSK